ncbi:hypothetical protein M513_06382 [Trichuris suis]|uniref:Uncharacterized protein n=1 Tax=Trichuris suis TaxID=68888 RepID=A0A085M680_9BILA|nr:hypothetical protein M513_06382 [Trichuris suis]
MPAQRTDSQFYKVRPAVALWKRNSEGNPTAVDERKLAPQPPHLAPSCAGLLLFFPCRLKEATFMKKIIFCLK